MIVSPRTDCSHIQKEKMYNEEKLKDIMFNKVKCEKCDEKNELWICLYCSLAFCGRYIHSHFKEHYLSNNDHCICISLLDLSMWCYQCMTPGFPDQGSYIESPQLAQYINIISDWKFGTDCPRTLNVLNTMSNEDIYKLKYQNFIELLKNNQFKLIIFMTGAGISTSAGIPDFRSNSGLFNQLMNKYGLQKPEEFFLKETFIKQPELLYDFLKQINFDVYKPTITHLFILYLINKGINCHIITQNIDGLEIKAGIPKEKITFAHGTLKEANCVLCNKKIDIDEIYQCMKNNEIKKCPDCNGPCKPDIILYGENLPNDFYERMKLFEECDLGIVIGTSLKVEPFSCLPYLLKKNSWKLAINKTKIGNFNYNDLTTHELFLQGMTDDIITSILKECGWWDDFNQRFYA